MTMAITAAPSDSLRRRLTEILLICRHELMRMIRTPRAGIILLLYVLVACFSAFLFHCAYDFLSDLSPTGRQDPVAVTNAYRQALTGIFSADTATLDWLVQMPPFLLFFFKFNQVFIPCLIILTGFDMMAAEFEAKSLRYLTPRIHRSSLLLGKTLAYGVVILVLITLLSTLALMFSLTATIRGFDADSVDLATQIKGTIHLEAILFTAILPYLALTALFSSLTKTPLYSLILSFAALAGLFILQLLSHLNRLAVLKWLVPASYEPWLISSDPITVAGAFIGTMFFVVLFLGLGILQLKKTNL